MNNQKYYCVLKLILGYMNFFATDSRSSSWKDWSKCSLLTHCRAITAILYTAHFL